MRARAIVAGPFRVSAAGWSHAPVMAASGLRHRRSGLCPLALGWGLLLAGRSVHGRGMAEPLTVVGLDAAGAVIGSTPLAPGGRVTFPGAVAVLELPAGVAVPDPGTALVWRPVVG